ncbi:MAG: hypothetical protein HFI30_07100 [Lachnospiraceae bacterium]|jgi:hypothetical protein|nr:hypothetical protein [Lachnospiraceae bacterium]
MFEKIKRILAFAGAILLATMYIGTLVFALIDSPWASDWLKASLSMTLVIPVLLYAYIFIYRLLKGRGASGREGEQTPERKD